MSLSQVYVETKRESRYKLLVEEFDTSFKISEIPQGQHAVNCHKLHAAELIAAIAEVAGCTIEQIAQAMGVQAPTQAHAWIPVSERLPSEKGDYNVTIPDNESVVTWWFTPNSVGIGGPDFWRREVLAWQPLPDAWKAGA